MSHGQDVEAGKKLPTSRCYKPDIQLNSGKEQKCFNQFGQ